MIVYYGIALVLLLLLNFFLIPKLNKVQIEETTYGNFLDMLEKDQISKVSVDSGAGVITFADKSDPVHYYETGIMNDYKLVDRLLEAGLTDFETPIVE
jgi:cell division protease FtsH